MSGGAGSVPLQRTHDDHSAISLRRAVCHPALVRNSKMLEDNNVDDDIKLDTEAEDVYAQSVLRQLETMDNEEEDAKACPICFETMEDDQVFVAGCKHTGSVEPVILRAFLLSAKMGYRCKNCFVEHLRKLSSEGKPGTCPLCFGPAEVSIQKRHHLVARYSTVWWYYRKPNSLR